MAIINSKQAFIAMLISASLAITFVFETTQAAEDADSLVEGRDFDTVFPYEKPKKPQVVEFFSFMCPACFRRETSVLRWKKQKPDSVELLKIPVGFGRNTWQLSAKAFYIAEELDVADKFSKLMFQKIHIDNKPPNNLKAIGNLFSDLGISTEQFNKAEKSFAVNSKMRKADFLTKKYKVPSVPYFLINFKYTATEATMQNQDSLFRLWNLLPSRDF